MATKLTLKLLINNATNKVLFAEAGKEVVDFLFGLLEMPLGSVVKLLINSQDVAPMSVSIVNLYKSIEEMDETYLQAREVRTTLLDPIRRRPLSQSTLLLPSASATASKPANKKLYTCSGAGISNYMFSVGISNSQLASGISNPPFGGSSTHSGNCNKKYVSYVYGTVCPQCNCQMTTKVSLVNSAKDEGNDDGYNNSSNLGFVKGVVTYTIMDDLTIAPMSTISGITMLNKFNVKDVGSLKEMTVELDINKALALLKASLQSKTALTDVFLKGAN